MKPSQSSSLVVLLWHACVAALIALLPSVTGGLGFWHDAGPDRALSTDLAALYFVAAIGLTVGQRGGRKLTLPVVLGSVLAALGIAVLIFIVTHKTPGLTRSVVIAMFGLAVVLAPIGFLMSRVRWLGLAVLVVALGGIVGINLQRMHKAQHKTLVQASESVMASEFYELKVTDYDAVVPRTDNWGGGLTRVGDRFVLVTGDGRLYALGLGTGKDGLKVKELPYHVPLNLQEFTSSVNDSGKYGVEVHSDAADRIKAVQTWQFRVATVFATEEGGRMRLFASHHYWNKAQRCFVVRVSQMDADSAAFLSGAADQQWKTIFESKPCLPLEGEEAVHANNPFAGMEVGGRMHMYDPKTLMLTLGDHDFTGLETKRKVAQEPDNSYGKILLLHLDTGTSETFSMGHRNPQGLYIERGGRIWETEHGPQGGDELNLIHQGGNYGWPIVTYGTDYGEFGWPQNPQQGRHEGFVKPVFAWVPSIGTSNLIELETDRFPLWKGDLFVASLHGKTVFRVRLEGDSVVYAEPLEIGQRIRDIIEAPDGRIVLWTDHNDIFSIEPASGSSGAGLFAGKCGGCHKTADGATNSYGPDLFGVVGRPVASVPGFDYSGAMKKFGGKWTEERLDAFIKNPQGTVPGTAMTYAGVANADERAAIIAHLKSRK